MQIRGTTLIFYSGAGPSTGSDLTRLARIMLLTLVFADEFMGDLLNKRLLLPCTNRRLSKSLLPVFLPNHHISSC